MDAWIKTGSIIVARKRMNVAFLADAWIKINHIEYTNDSILSHPSRMRGLKSIQEEKQMLIGQSHPSRMRGLK